MNEIEGGYSLSRHRFLMQRRQGIHLFCQNGNAAASVEKSSQVLCNIDLSLIAAERTFETDEVRCDLNKNVSIGFRLAKNSIMPLDSISDY